MVGPSSNSIETRLFKLMSDKDKLESEISTYGEILAQNDNVGMAGSLVDDEGFPRSDIDIYQVRQARQQIICLQNDHKVLMKDIEQLMHELHANVNQAQSAQNISYRVSGMNLNDRSSDDTVENTNASQKSILKVISVSAGSPAEQAGLRKNDEICEFGSANANNFDTKLDTIANIVNHMRDRRIALKVRRNSEVLNLILIPKSWSGPGLLGCSIVVNNN